MDGGASNTVPKSSLWPMRWLIFMLMTGTDTADDNRHLCSSTTYIKVNTVVANLNWQRDKSEERLNSYNLYSEALASIFYFYKVRSLYIQLICKAFCLQ